LFFEEANVIVRRDAVRRGEDGGREWLYYSDAGALTQFGAYVETLQPGARSSVRHWHEKEDEFLYVLSGEVTIVENDGETVLAPGDAACFPAGVSNAHAALNRSSAPCTYIIFGTRVTHDVAHYPDEKLRLCTEGEQWRLEREDGSVVKSGTCKSPPGRE
jgi:uncharacterized cupin superfamily protein